MDLANLFQAQAPVPAFAQGQILTFNSLTGANTVNVGGSVFTNLPLLNVPDAINMVAGSVVMLAQLGGSYAIMGRVVVPSSALLNTSAVSVGQASGSANITSLATTAASKLTVSTTAPSWCNRVTFMAIGSASAKNTGATNPDILTTLMQMTITGYGPFSGGSISDGANTGEYACTTVSSAQNGLLIAGGASIQFDLMVSSTTSAWAAAAGNCNIDAVLIYQRF